jgi:hypothetical protein
MQLPTNDCVNAFPNVRSDFQNLRLGSIKLLQKIVASQKNQNINHLAKLLQKIIASKKNQRIPEKPTHHMLLLSFESSCKVVTKDHSIPEKPAHHMLLPG